MTFGSSYDDKRAAFKAKKEAFKKKYEWWKPWFAWYPVKLDNGQWAWFEKVEFKGCFTYTEYYYYVTGGLFTPGECRSYNLGYPKFISWQYRSWN